MNRGSSGRLTQLLRFAFFLGLCLGLAALVRLCFLTVLTYFLMPSQPRLQDLSEASSGLGIYPAALGSMLFVFALRFVTPFPRDYNRGFFSWKPFRQNFIPGLLQGLAIGLTLALAFWLSGVYRFQASWPALEEGLGGALSLLSRGLALGVLVYCEEIIFRKVLLEGFGKDRKNFVPVLCVSIGFCLLKEIQFDLSWMQRLTLFLLSLLLTLEAQARADWLRGTGSVAGFLLMVHLGFGLPVFASEGSGLLVLQYLGGADRLAVFLTGGLGGPLSSIATQAIVCGAVLQRWIKQKNMRLINDRA